MAESDIGTLRMLVPEGPGGCAGAGRRTANQPAGTEDGRDEQVEADDVQASYRVTQVDGALVATELVGQGHNPAYQPLRAR